MDTALNQDLVVSHNSWRARIAAGTERLATLGGWQGRAGAVNVVGRLATIGPDGTVAPGAGGFDAGVAVAAGLIPADKARLAARLHASYDAEVLTQVVAETTAWDADSETTWWLAACNICDDLPSTPETFATQVARFEQLAASPLARLAVATAAWDDMCDAFEAWPDAPAADRVRVARVLRDGGAQGAYVSGFDVAVHHATNYDLWFVGTWRPALGFDVATFDWEDPDRAGHRGRSGPVGGSLAYVKAASAAELEAVLAAVRVS